MATYTPKALVPMTALPNPVEQSLGYTVPGSTTAIIRTIVACQTQSGGGTTTWAVSLAAITNDGADVNWLFYDNFINGSDTQIFNGWWVAPTGSNPRGLRTFATVTLGLFGYEYA